MSYPVTVGQVVQVRSPLHGTTYPVTVTECGRASFLGTNARGKEVKVRSYSLVTGLESYVPPPQQPGEKILKVTVQPSEALTKALDALLPGDAVTEEPSPAEALATKLSGELVLKPRGIDPTKVLDQPRKRKRKSFGKREIEFTRDSKTYLIKWDGGGSYQLLSDDGTEVFRANSGLELFNCVEEL